MATPQYVTVPLANKPPSFWLLPWLLSPDPKVPFLQAQFHMLTPLHVRKLFLCHPLKSLNIILSRQCKPYFPSAFLQLSSTVCTSSLSCSTFHIQVRHFLLAVCTPVERSHRHQAGEMLTTEQLVLTALSNWSLSICHRSLELSYLPLVSVVP